MIIAMAMIGVVGIALLALATRFAAESKMTRYGGQDAQLRQILLAGAVAARQQMGQPDTPRQGQRLVVLPADIDGEDASLVLRFEPSAADGVRNVLIDASLDGRLLRQTLRFEQSDSQWRIVEATLDR